MGNKLVLSREKVSRQKGRIHSPSFLNQIQCQQGRITIIKRKQSFSRCCSMNSASSFPTIRKSPFPWRPLGTTHPVLSFKLRGNPGRRGADLNRVTQQVLAEQALALRSAATSPKLVVSKLLKTLLIFFFASNNWKDWAIHQCMIIA